MTSIKLPYFLYDVFTDRQFGGGQLAVVDTRGVNPSDVSQDVMLRLANEFNLPETVFIFDPDLPDHHARIRIFTAVTELPMAGHPTVGTSIHLYSTTPDLDETFVLELGVGPTKIEIENVSKERNDAAAFMFQQPQEKWSAQEVDKEKLCEGFGVSVDVLHKQYPLEFWSAGLAFLIMPCTDKQSLYSLVPNQSHLYSVLEGLPAHHVYAFAFTDEGIHCRMFNSDVGDMAEDPATGSAAGALTHYLNEHLPETFHDDASILTLTQGIAMNRPSKIMVSLSHDDDKKAVPRVGGTAVSIASGTIVVNA